uniref:Uncharacterized protein n=1 Tax=Arundo donax TaxID=35708 RepID=A0A0A9H8L3_ARUDO
MEVLVPVPIQSHNTSDMDSSGFHLKSYAILLTQGLKRME